MSDFSNRTILIIEDDNILNKLIQKQLIKVGYKTHGVSNISDAISWIKNNDYSLIIIDYLLGHEDASLFIKEAQTQFNRTPPFIIMTGNGDERVAVEMMKMGALDYLIKDTAFIDLLPAIVKQVLEHLQIKHEFKEAQRNLEESEIRHRLLAESISDLIDKKDINRRFTYLSPLSKQILGYAEHELLNKSIFNFIHPDDKENVIEYYNNICKGFTNTIIKYRFFKKNKQYVWLETNTRVFYHNETKEITELVSVSRDITEVLNTEKLIKEKETAELSNKAKSEFLANISHEIRNPMNAIIGISNALLKTNLTDDQKKYINSICISSSNLMNLINDILDFSKIESKHIVLNNSDFNIDEITQEVITMFENQAFEKDIKLEYFIEDDIKNIQLWGDAFKVKQIITNLVNNAIKFTDRGTVHVQVRSEFRELNAVKILIEIADTGIGIKKEDFDKVFNIFTQLNNSFTNKYPGTGLGLTIVKKITELLSGTINFESEEGKGTIFKVHIPFSISKTKSLKYEDFFKETKPDFDLGHLKILLAEDDSINQLYLKGFLQSFNWQVETAFNGEQALEKYKNGTFDIILMDGQMPKMDGLEATKYIRQFEKENNKPHTPIIAITGYAIQEDRDKFLQAGLDDYITKPINENKLFDVIKKYCLNEQTN